MDLHEEWEYVLPSSARISDAGKLPRDLIVPIVADYAGQQRQMHETIVMNIHSVNYGEDFILDVSHMSKE